MEAILLTIPGQCFCVICFTFAFSFYTVLMFLTALWSPAGKG